MKDLPDIVENPKAPHAAALVRLIAQRYGINANVLAEITRLAKIADPSQPGRWAKGTVRIGPANATKLRAAFPRCRKEIDAAVRGDHADKLEKDAEGVLDPQPAAPIWTDAEREAWKPDRPQARGAHPRGRDGDRRGDAGCRR